MRPWEAKAGSIKRAIVNGFLGYWLDVLIFTRSQGTHTTDHVYFGENDGFSGPGTFHHHVLAAVSGSWWSGPFDQRGIAISDQRDGMPSGYHVLEVEGTDMAVRYKGSGRPVGEQMRIMFDVSHHG